jgi:hypothetical protein
MSSRVLYLTIPTMGMTSPEELLMVSSLLWSSIYMKYGIFYPKKIALASNLYYMD